MHELLISSVSITAGQWFAEYFREVHLNTFQYLQKPYIPCVEGKS